MSDEQHMQDVNVQGYNQPTYDQTYAQPASTAQPVAQPQYGQAYGQSGEVNYNQPPPVYAQPAQSGGQGAAAASPDTVGCNMGAMKRVFMSVPGILRSVEWFFALLAFATMSSQSQLSAVMSDGGNFVIAMGVLVWLYTMAILICDIFNLHATVSLLPLIEFSFDCLWCLLCFIAGIVGGARCTQSIGNGVSGSYCSNDFISANDAQAGVAFIFLTCFTLMGSIYFSYRRWRK